MTEKELIKLSTLPNDVPATIREVSTDARVSRLLAIGLRPGKSIIRRRQTLSGKTIFLEGNAGQFGLRKEEADLIWVTIDPS